MPTKKPPPAITVARLPPDEQISYLVHQHEDFADWRMTVDKRLEQGEEATQQLNVKVDNVERKLDGGFSTVNGRMNETLLMVQQVLYVVQGQRTPGLETDGLNQQFVAFKSQIQADVAALHLAHHENAVAVSARRGWIAGAIAVGGLFIGAVGTWFYNTLITILPHTK